MLISLTAKGQYTPTAPNATFIAQSSVSFITKFNVSVNDISLPNKKHCIVTENMLYVANTVRAAQDSINADVVYELPLQWYYVSYGANSLIFKGKQTKVELMSDNSEKIYALRKYVKHMTIQPNFEAEFEVMRTVKKSFNEESFLAARYTDNVMFFCRRYTVGGKTNKKKADEVLRLLSISEKLKSIKVISHAEFMYDDGERITIVYRYIDSPMVRGTRFKFTSAEIRHVLSQLQKFDAELRKHNMVLIKYDLTDFRLQHTSDNFCDSQIVLSTLEYVIDVRQMCHVHKDFKSKLYMAPELHAPAQVELSRDAVSLFGIGQLLLSLVSGANLKVMKLRNMQEASYMNTLRAKGVQSSEVDPLRMLISG